MFTRIIDKKERLCGKNYAKLAKNTSKERNWTRKAIHPDGRIKDLSNAFLYLVKCAQQRKRLSLDFVREVSAKVMQHTGKEVYTTIGGYDTSLGDFRLGEEYYEEGVLANYAQIPDMLEQLCKETNEKLGNVHI